MHTHANKKPQQHNERKKMEKKENFLYTRSLTRHNINIFVGNIHVIYKIVFFRTRGWAEFIFEVNFLIHF